MKGKHSMSNTEKKPKSGLLIRSLTAIPLLIMLVIALIVGGWVFACIASLCLGVAVHEELSALEKGGHKPLWWTAYAAVGIDLAITLFIYFTPYYFNPIFLILPSYALLIFVIIFLIMRRKQPDIQDINMSILPVLSIGLTGMCLMAVTYVQGDATLADNIIRQRMLVAMTFAVPIAGDTFAYFVGSIVGGPKLCPAISPKKTIAGGVGGLLGSIVFAILTGWLFKLAAPEVHFPPFWANAVVGFFGGIAGVMGDLFASMIKRHCGVKDFGTIFPGHGGMMDRIDSILFTAVIIYSYSLLIR